MGGLHYSAWYGHNEVVQFLLEANANVNLTNPSGSTPLHLSAGTGRIEVVKSLLKFNADRNLKNADKHTALDVVLQCKPENYEDVLKLFEN